MKKVSFIWRMLFLWMFGIACGILITVTTIKTKVEKGQVINIGKIKIKNANDTDFRIYPEQNQKEETEKKTKRELRKERRQNNE